MVSLRAVVLLAVVSQTCAFTSTRKPKSTTMTTTNIRIHSTPLATTTETIQLPILHKSTTRLSVSSNDEPFNNPSGDVGDSINNNNNNRYLTPETAFGAEVVPEGQRPVNEYLEMKRAPLFGWASNEVGMQGLLQRLAIFYTVVFAAIGYPIAGATFTQEGYLFQKLAAANVGTLGLVMILLIRLYSGWGYVGARLQSKIIEYEETGWYDGNVEQKTEAEYKRDQFLYKSDVQPAADRVKALTLGVAALWVASCVALNMVVSMKPIFNEYDPTVLNRVQFDDDYANAAAKAAGSRPTYCDNRYYRAVANGGQGCN